MKKIKGLSGVISVITALSIMLTCVMPAFSAYADDGVFHKDEIQMYYQESDIMVPDKDDEGKDYREVMKEGDKLQLTYKLIETGMPEGGSVYWYSETPTLVNVDQTGLVRAFDSSKGAAIQTWIDNDVKTIPLVGKTLGSLIESALFNDTIDLDSMDTEQIINVLKIALGGNSYADSILDSLKDYLDSINSVIHCQLKDADGNVLCEDTLRILVKKNDAWYASFLPNGTHITNKEELPEIVAVGSTVQLTAITTPLRLHYGVEYSIKSNSVYSGGSDIASVDENGLVTFNAPGTVTVTASPDSEDVLEGVKKLLIYVDRLLEENEDMDTEKVADVLVDYLGINISKSVVKGALDVLIAVRKRTGSMEEALNNSNGTLQSIANYALQFAYNDTVTFTVVEPVPLEDFEIDGLSSVQEGSQIQLYVSEVTPDIGDKNDVEWFSSNESVAYVDKETGIVTARDSGGSYNTSSQQVTITAISKENKISKSKTIKVTGKNGQYLSDVALNGPEYLGTNEEYDFTYTAYPSRSSGWNLTVKWGLISGYDDEGNALISWASDEEGASDNFAEIDKNGHYTSIGNGSSTVILEVKTGYELSDGSFYEISKITKTHKIQNSTPVKSITLSAQKLSGSSDPVIKTVEVNGAEKTFVTVKENTTAILYNKGIKVAADVQPANAANANIVWHIDNDDFQFKNESSSAKTVEVRAKYGSESTGAVNIWCESEDGNAVSDKITFVLTRNNATGNSIDDDEIEIARGKSQSVTHTMSFDGSLTANLYACKRAYWYSDNEKVLTVSNANNADGDASINAVEVGYATLYCVSYDGGFIDSVPVTVVADKSYLRNLVNLCDRTVIKKTEENKALYSDYMKKLDKASYVLYDYKMASQSTCDTYADKLLEAFTKIGGYVPIGEVEITSRKNEILDKKFITYNVGTLSYYTNTSYDLNFIIQPENAMYTKVEWTSSSSKISVDSSGVCKPTSNDPCSAYITCKVYDYLGNTVTDGVWVAFSKTPATGLELDTYEINNAKIGESYKLTENVLPDGRYNSASCKDVFWKSTDEKIASVDESGNVAFLRGGSCKIICTTCDGGYSAECSVNVVTNFDSISSLINEFEAKGLKETDYYPDTYLTFIAVMQDAKAMVEAGTASQDEVDTMYEQLQSAYSSLKEYVYIDHTEIYVDGEKSSEYYQEKVGTLSLYTSASVKVNVRLYPYNGSYEKIEWVSSNSTVNVSSDGVAKPSSNKACYSTVSCIVTDHFGNEYTASVNVSFAKTPVTGVSFDNDEAEGDIDETIKLGYTVTPKGGLLQSSADIKDVFFTSDNTDAAVVDESGNVTFVATGAANITVTTCDGGFTDTVFVKTKGNREALYEAIETYKDIEYTDYDYDYAMTFKAAYDAAVDATTNYNLTQAEIDSTTETLFAAAQELSEHPFISIENINLDYVGYNGYHQQKESGSVDERNAVSIALSNGYSTIYTTNTCDINASVYPENAMYSDVRIETVSSTRMSIDASGSKVTCRPTLRNGGFADLRFVYTDAFGRETSREITVVLAIDVVRGLNIEQEDFSVVATDESVQLTASLTSSSGKTSDLSFTNIIWSSSDEEIATVENGKVTFVNDGIVTITAKSVDGGYTDSVTITILADFTKLTQAISEYSTVLDDSRGKFIYTEESLDVLEAALNEGIAVAADETSRQAIVNAAYNNITEAYNSLERYVPCESILLTLDDTNSAVSVVNEGFIRYTGTSLNNKSFKLGVVTAPERSRYEGISFSSNNSNITVSNSGTVTSTSSASKSALITCTVTNYDGAQKTATIYVSFVRYGVTGITFEGSEDVFGVSGATKSAKPVITFSTSNPGSSYCVSDCIWSSSNESIATVNENGTVTFIAPGTAEITAITKDGGYTAKTNVYTTWDTTALFAAINEAKNIKYDDYAYSYGMAFKEKYDTAVAVSKQYSATQDTIDVATEELIEAITALEGHEFIYPNLSLTYGDGVVINENDRVQTDDNYQVSIFANIDNDEMVKSSSFTFTDAENVSVQQNGMSLLVTRLEETGSLTLKLNAIDDYGREYSVIRHIYVVEQIIPATDALITVNGEVIETGSTYNVSCSGNYSNFTALTVGYIPIPANANDIASVTYKNSSTLSSLSPIKVDSTTGEITLSGASSWLSSYTAEISVTITNNDGSSFTKKFNIKVTKK